MCKASSGQMDRLADTPTDNEKTIYIHPSLKEDNNNNNIKT